MIDFESHLSTLLDDVAASVHPHPHPDPDSVFLPTVKTVPTDVHRFRPRFAAVAAAGVVLLGGSAFAMEKLTADPPSRIEPADEPLTEATDAPTTTELEPETATTLEAAVVETTTPKEEPVYKPVVVVDPSVPKTEPTVPPTEPTTIPPVVIEFTANLGFDGRAKAPMKQGFYGTAMPGSAIRAASPYGVAETTANSDGKWEVKLVMYEVPVGTLVPVRITSSTSDRVREFTLERLAPPAPAVIEFTANLGANGQANTPMTQGFYGTAQPGSAIRIACDWGVVETVAGPEGKWDATLVMPEVPEGAKFGVRITSSTSDKVREFLLQRPGTPAPTFVPFTANAALTTTDHTPPVNEYWGTSTAGAVISITSEYGSTQVESSAEGKWSARLEFPSAPVGTTFNVHLTSSKGEAVYDFPLTVAGPV